MDTIKDHLKSKKHIARKEAKSGKERQASLTSMAKSKCPREEFVLENCSMADIPLEKLEPFLLKHCQQGGA